MKHKYVFGIVASFLVAALMYGGAQAVARENRPDRAEARDTAIAVSAERREEARQAAEQRIQERREAIQTKLDERRREACEKRQDAINRIADQAGERIIRYIDTFDSIEQRAVAFAEDKAVTVENLADLQAETAEKKAAAIEAAGAVEAAELDCDSEGVNREIGASIRESLAAGKEALVVYRAAVKDLVQAVLQANGERRETTESDSTTETEETTSESEEQL